MVSGKEGSSKPQNKWKMSRRNFAAASAALATGLVTQSRPGVAGGLFGDWLKGDGKKNGGGHCFLAGTKIQTPAGEVPVEQLKDGDLVVTQSGAAKPILGVVSLPTVRLDDNGWPASALPVRIERGALGPELPHSDLYLSQTHMLLVDGVLMPAGYLVNGDTIKVVEPEGPEQLNYYHIGLAGHDVIFAEGAPCETFVEAYTETYAPIIHLGGVRTRVGSRLRSAISPLIDIRNPADVVRDRLEERAELIRAA